MNKIILIFAMLLIGCTNMSKKAYLISCSNLECRTLYTFSTFNLCKTAMDIIVGLPSDEPRALSCIYKAYYE